MDPLVRTGGSRHTGLAALPHHNNHRNRVVYIFLSDGHSEYFYGKLNSVEKQLANSRRYFLRIHQSFLVNYDYIKKLNFFNVTIYIGDDEMELKISEDRQKEVRRKLCEIAGGKAVVE